MPNFNIPSQEALQIQIPPDRIRLPPQPCRCKKIDSGSYKTPYAWNSNHPMVKAQEEEKLLNGSILMKILQDHPKFKQV